MADNSHRPEELVDSLKRRGQLAIIIRYITLIVVVILLAIYIGNLLFGTNSLEVLYRLHIQEKNLRRSIKYLKRENAHLQKEYFELKEMEPE